VVPLKLLCEHPRLLPPLKLSLLPALATCQLAQYFWADCRPRRNRSGGKLVPTHPTTSGNTTTTIWPRGSSFSLYSFPLPRFCSLFNLRLSSQRKRQREIDRARESVFVWKGGGRCETQRPGALEKSSWGRGRRSET